MMSAKETILSQDFLTSEEIRFRLEDCHYFAKCAKEAFEEALWCFQQFQHHASLLEIELNKIGRKA